MKTAIINLETIVSGDWRAPFAEGDAILCEDGRISAIGAAGDLDIDAADVVIDAGGATAAPGFIDSHVHITFGDYTPRQKTVGFLEKLPAWRDDHGDQRLGGPHARPPLGPRRRQGAGHRRATLFPRLPAGRDARFRGLRHPRAGPEGKRFRRDGRRGRLAGQGRFRRLRRPDGIRALHRHGQGAGLRHHHAYRRRLDPRLLPDLGRACHRGGAGRLVPRQWRPRRHAGRRFRARDPRKRGRAADLHGGQPAHGNFCASTARLRSMPSTAC